MHAQACVPWLQRALAAVAVAALTTATAGQFAANVAVTVRLLPSSGACGVLGREAQVSVACTPPGGSLLPEPGAVPYQRVGTIQATGVVVQPLPLYSDGVRISSWRIVQLDNAQYLELTVAW